MWLLESTKYPIHGFSHWELEFPEVFLRRTGISKQATGFAVVLGNPPYDVLAEKELGRDISEEKTFFRSQHLYAPSLNGKNNLYKLFICRAVELLSQEGQVSFIVPMTLLGDDQAKGVRQLLLRKVGLREVHAFPQKDDPKRRVFPEAKLSTTVFVADRGRAAKRFKMRAYPGRIFENNAACVNLEPNQIASFDPSNQTIPSCTQADWNIATRTLGLTSIQRIGDLCCGFQGEVNETTDGRRGYVTRDPEDGPEVVRGANITRYAIRSASQGEALYLKQDEFVAGKPRSEKVHHHNEARVIWQESSPQNNYRRIIAAYLPPGYFCNHVVNYIPEEGSKHASRFVFVC